MEALTGLSAGIEMRKKNQSSFHLKINLTIFLVMIILLSNEQRGN